MISVANVAIKVEQARSAKKKICLTTHIVDINHYIFTTEKHRCKVYIAIDKPQMY